MIKESHIDEHTKEPAFFVTEDQPDVLKAIEIFQFEELQPTGKTALELLDSQLENVADINSPEADEQFATYMDIEMSRLISSFENISNEGEAALIDFVVSSASQPALAKSLTEAFGKEVTANISTTEIMSVFQSGKISHRLFAAMLRHRHAHLQNKLEAEKALIERFTAEFLADVDRLRQQGVLNVPDDVVRKRLALIRVSYRDALGRIKGKGIASFAPESRIVTLYLAGSEAEKKHRYYHELVHGTLAGTVISSIPSGLEWSDTRDIVYSKNGLEFSPSKKELSTKPNSTDTWLNEAVTESIAILLQNGDLTDMTSYPMERLQLMSYLKEGLTLRELIAAYTENGAGLSSEHLSHWQHLSDVMDIIAKKPGVLDGWENRQKPTKFNEAKRTIIETQRSNMNDVFNSDFIAATAT